MAATKINNSTQESNSLELYWSDIRQTQPLSRRQENEYFQRARAGDEAARQTLITANLRFVVSVAREYKEYGLSLVELISEGNVGLLEAFEQEIVEHLTNSGSNLTRRQCVEEACVDGDPARRVERAQEILGPSHVDGSLSTDAAVRLCHQCCGIERPFDTAIQNGRNEAGQVLDDASANGDQSFVPAEASRDDFLDNDERLLGRLDGFVCRDGSQSVVRREPCQASSLYLRQRFIDDEET